MKQLLIIASLLISLTASAADFTDADRTHFENQCKDILNEVIRVFKDKHPNPKVKKHDRVIDTIVKSVHPWSLWNNVEMMVELLDPYRPNWLWEIDPLPRNHVDFRWSDDKRALVVVASLWGDKFFDKIEDGQTLKDESIKVGVFKNIRIKPYGDAELLETRIKKDYPAWFRDEIELDPNSQYNYFDSYTAQDGTRVVNWDLWLDPDEMSPPFHGWFTWHEKNQLLALKERWDNFTFDESEWANNLRTETPFIQGYGHQGDAKLTVRTTRRKEYQTWNLQGLIEFDSEFFVYINLKRFNGATFSYRTHSYSLNRCNASFSNADDLVAWLDEEGDKADEARATIDKPWTMEINLPIGTQYSGTREKITYGNQ